MVRFSAIAFVVALTLVSLPAVSSADDGSTTTTTTATTTTTTTTTIAVTTTTIAPPPVEDESPPPPAAEPVGDADPATDDPDADIDDPADERRVPKRRVRRIDVTRKFVFPVVGPNYYYPGFGACRDDCEREHHGIDIMTYGWKGVPVVAAHAGTIRKVRDDRAWCIVEVVARDGWYTRYVHLNNDTPGYDDEDYECLLPGIEPGAPVEAGQVIGWVGDSGNAEWTPPHVHFELRTPSGYPVDPYKSLKKAERISFQRVGNGDPIETAAEIASYSYRNGSGIVNVMATTDYAELQAGGFSSLDLSGPLLLSEPDRLPAATTAAFEKLDADRVITLGDGLNSTVIDQLELRFRIVAHQELPRRIVDSSVEPDTGEIVENPEVEPSPFSIVVIGDRSEMPDDTADDLGRVAMVIPTTILDDTASARRIGRNSYQGPGRSGTRYVLYYQTGDSYLRIRAKETPEIPPDYGVIVVETGRASEATLTFLQSLAGLPVMPLWR